MEQPFVYCGIVVTSPSLRQLILLVLKAEASMDTDQGPKSAERQVATMLQSIAI